MDNDATIRDLIARTRPAPLPAAFDREAAGPPHIPAPVRAKAGTAVITSNDGGGAYKVSETARAAGALAAMTAPDGFVDRTAYAVNGSEQWEVGDPVLYVQVPTDEAAGTFTTYIERGLGPVTLDTSVTFCGLLNIRVDAAGGVVACQVSTGGSPATKWVDNRGRDV